MKTITVEGIEKCENTCIVDLKENLKIKRIDAEILFSDVKENICEFEIKYAQNTITEDLIYLGKVLVNKNEGFIYEASYAFLASHLYINVPEGAVINKLYIIEEDEDDPFDCYPKCIDIDLKNNYILDSVSVFTSKSGYTNYKLYTSLNDRDFELSAVKNDDKPCGQDGDIFSFDKKEARIIRVYMEYNSSSAKTGFEKITFKGIKSGTEIIPRPEIHIEKFEDSQYNREITVQDTVNELYGIIERRIGVEYKNWFDFELGMQRKYDWFELSDNNGKIKIKGNNGVSIATGLNYYLKYYCKVCISQVGDQTRMPDMVIPVNQTIYRETPAKIRYSYNYCTLSYTMAFWGEEEWQKEIDWLALNGVNAVLDITAQEEVWRRFLTQIGYSHKEIKNFITGPAYYSWAYMANMFGYGGPVHDSWFAKRTQLARKNHLVMRKLEMYPILQGYSGMVPPDIKKYDKDVKVIPQGIWCSFMRPFMLMTTSPCFNKYAKMFYKAQKDVFGCYSKFFATDPFHEGGITGDMKPHDISFRILSEMLNNNKDAVWIIQAWQFNPSSELLRGIADIKDGKNHALILDLYAEKNPRHNKGKKGSPFNGYSTEFDNTPWIFCMLNNFGGRMGLHGHLDNLVNNIPLAFNKCKAIAGIGITSEATQNNPVLYDFLFESVWQNNADKLLVYDMDKWLREYSIRRYGGYSKNTEKVWEILYNTVYKAEYNMIKQGAPECIICARPSLEIKSASSWGNVQIGYDKNELECAQKLLEKDYELFKNSNSYLYDLVTVSQQVLSNKALDLYNSLVKAFNDNNISMFKDIASKLLNIADKMENLTSKNNYYLLDTWIQKARKLSKNTDDFTERLYVLNARALISTWGSYTQAETGGLRDYSNRQWSELFGSYYKPRWIRWLKARENELLGLPFEKDINWFDFEWKWARKYDIARQINNKE